GDPTRTAVSVSLVSRLKSLASTLDVDVNWVSSLPEKPAPLSAKATGAVPNQKWLLPESRESPAATPGLITGSSVLLESCTSTKLTVREPCGVIDHWVPGLLERSTIRVPAAWPLQF